MSVDRLRKMARHSHKLLVITAALTQIKSRYAYSAASPNQITQSLVAVLAGLQVPFVCTEMHEPGEKLGASFLYQVYLYHWLQANNYGSRLTACDL